METAIEVNLSGWLAFENSRLPYRQMPIQLGELTTYLRGEGVSTLATSFDNLDTDGEVFMQNIDGYQVAFSIDRKMVGFQPLSSIVVYHWTANFLERELCRGEKLFPGIIE